MILSEMSEICRRKCKLAAAMSHYFTEFAYYDIVYILKTNYGKNATTEISR